MTTDIDAEVAFAQAQTQMFVLLTLAYKISQSYAHDEVTGYIGQALAELNSPGSGGES